jgi:TetR/AcrR family transcriptional regulator, transcriptional repressor for nem operon
MSRRDTAKAETREALIEAAISLFMEEGLDQPSLDAICARAGYTRGAFYVHFKDRETLQVAVMERVHRAFLGVIVETGDGANDLHATIDRFVNLYQAIRNGHESAGILALGVSHIHLVLAAAARSEDIADRFTGLAVEGVTRLVGVIQAGQSAGTVRRDMDPLQGAQLLVLMVLGALNAAGMPIDVLGARDTIYRLIAPLETFHVA